MVSDRGLNFTLPFGSQLLHSTLDSNTLFGSGLPLRSIKVKKLVASLSDILPILMSTLSMGGSCQGHMRSRHPLVVLWLPINTIGSWLLCAQISEKEEGK